MTKAKFLLTYMPPPEPRIVTSHDLRYFEPCYCTGYSKVNGGICTRCNGTGYIGVQSIELINV